MGQGECIHLKRKFNLYSIRLNNFTYICLMEINNELHIGQKVIWTIGAFKMIGVVFCNTTPTKVNIQTHSRNGVPHFQQVEINKELLTKI